MKTDSKAHIIEYIQSKGPARPYDLAQSLGITAAAVHRHLKKMVELGELEKRGVAPKVFYVFKSKEPVLPATALSPEVSATLESSFSYIDPAGRILSGVSAFSLWRQKANPHQSLSSLAQEYWQIRAEADSHKKDGRIDATKRFEAIFSDCLLDKVFYQDFYSLIKFGKTKLGQLLLHGKQAQDKQIISQMARAALPLIEKLISEQKIQAVCWVPHSLPRQVPFLKVVESSLHLTLPRIEVVKAYAGKIPIAQKSLSKLSERIQNAEETMIVVPAQVNFGKVLLIDDAVGSGATLHELARKLKHKGAKKVIGFAFVGSYKGFEVIREV